MKSKMLSPNVRPQLARTGVVQATLVACAILIADSFVPTGVNVCVAYIAAVWLIQTTERKNWIWITAGICSLLTLAGIRLSPGGSEALFYVANRCLALLAIWSVAIVCVQNVSLLNRHRELELQLRESERIAQQSNRTKSEFLANMSHEIRTPMTAVLGYADLLAAHEDDAEKSEYLHTIKRNGVFLLEIINDILDLSKIEAGKSKVTTEKFSLHRLVADIRSTMDLRAREKQLEFQVEYNGKIPAKIESDLKRLRQILVNLIGNAIKFTEEGSVTLRITYLADATDPRVRMEIVDTGIGISAEQQTRLFQAFSQADASESRIFGGTRLGLAISQRLAQLLNGEITVQSSPGEGSTFTCTISAGDVQSEKLIEPSSNSKVQQPADQQCDQRLSCRVLVVDDRRDVRFLTQRILTGAGAEVSHAEDGIEALQMVKEAMANGEAWDLILLDMQMPRLDGYQTAARLREMKFDKPIIALTADAMHGDMALCLQSGCDAYLSKPIDAKELVELVAQHTQQYHNDKS